VRGDEHRDSRPAIGFDLVVVRCSRLIEPGDDQELPADQGPGVVLMLDAAFENVTEVVCGFGKLGVTAEKLGHTAAKRLAGYIASGAFAGPYLQDQLLLPFALAGGGSFTSVKLSEHTRTAARIVERFRGRSVRFETGQDGTGQLVEIVDRPI
jgi:RNA 3'-terminal phosphate cyclase (ATP)